MYEKYYWVIANLVGSLEYYWVIANLVYRFSVLSVCKHSDYTRWGSVTLYQPNKATPTHCV